MLDPISITLITMLISTAWLGYLFRRRGWNLIVGAGLGAAAGLIGPQIFLFPLGYCSLETENFVYVNLYIFDQLLRINIVLVITFLLVFVSTWGLVLLFYQLAQARYVSFSRATFLRKDTAPGAFRGWWFMPWLLLSPTLIVLVAFTYYPALQTFRLSTQLARLGAPRTAPVCLDNFANLFAGPRENAEYYILSNGHLFHMESAAYVKSLGVSLFLSFFIVLLANVFGLLIALMAHQPIKGAYIYRTLLIWPYALSAVVSGIIFRFLFNPLTGLINHLLGLVGIAPVPWLLDPNIAPWTVILSATWNIIGFNLLFYIAGLQNVPKDLLEAAAIDGANAWRRFRSITVPMLSPFIFFLIFTNLTYTFFDLFGLIDNLTTGGPVRATTNLIYDVYVQGIRNKDLGKAAAQSILLLMIVIGLTGLQFRILGKRVNYGV